MLCPICKKPVNDIDDPKAPNPSFPFCGERCKLIDLGRWLGERYQIPIKPADDAADFPPPMTDDAE
jgi:endogenous inhibitor of DNA gyrase (YacG/DUF329 family)